MARQNPDLPGIGIFGRASVVGVVTDSFSKELLRQIQRKMRDFTETTAGEITQRLNDPGGIGLANKRVAEAAHRTLIEYYDKEVTSRKRHQSYRIGMNRYSGGVLKRALQSPEMFAVSAESIAFPNEDILDREAKHWYRLNFGAGTEEQARTHVLRLWGQSSQFYVNRPAAPAFQMPIGRWGDLAYNGSPGGYGFYPRGTSKLPKLSTIRGRFYLEGAVEGMVRAIPKEYNAMIKRVISESAKAGESAANESFLGLTGFRF